MCQTGSLFNRIVQSNEYTVLIVFSTFFVDSVLMYSPAPILPVFLYEEKLKQKNHVETFPATTATRTDIWTTTTFFTELVKNTTEHGDSCGDNGQQKLIENESVPIGILLASKPFIQTFANLAVGPIVDRMGYDFPMVAGFIVMTVTSIIFALGENYGVLLFARSFQALGSSASSVSSLAMLSNRFANDKERATMLALSIGGYTVGSLVGPSFASVTYQFAGKSAPFFITGAAAFLVCILKLLTGRPKITNNIRERKKSSVIKMLKDPYILVAAGAIVIANLGTAELETGLPIWMVSTMCAAKWMLGVASLPLGIASLIGNIIVPRVVSKEKRWLSILLGLYVGVIGFVTMPFCKNLLEIFGPGALLGAGMTMVNSSVIPILAILADTRHNKSYGSMYAIVDSAFCIPGILGPLIAGVVIREIGFNWLMYISAIIYFILAPLMYFLRDPPPISEEEQAFIGQEFQQMDGVHPVSQTMSTIP